MATTFAIADTGSDNNGGTVLHAGDVDGDTGNRVQSLDIGVAAGTPDHGQNVPGVSHTYEFGAVSGDGVLGTAQAMFLPGNSAVDAVIMGKDAHRDLIHDIESIRVDATTIEVLGSGTPGGVGDVNFTTHGFNAQFPGTSGVIGTAEDKEAKVNRTDQGGFAIHQGTIGDPTQLDYPSKTQ